MVKNLLCLFLILQLVSRAQSWCSPGAVWHYTWSPIPFYDQKKGVVEDKYVGDTLISGKICKKISGTFTGKMYPAASTTVIPNFRVSYSYLEDSVLYAYTSNGFDTIVNLNAKIGDKWLRNRVLPYPCNARRAIVVTDTDHVIINNMNLKRIVTTYTNTYVLFNIIHTVSETDEFIERMMTSSKYIFPMHCELDDKTDFYIYNGELICYEDDKFSLYKRTGYTDCDYATALHELSALGYDISVYPNPAFDHLDIEISKPGTYKLSLSDVVSKKILLQNAINGTHRLDLSNLKNGIYFLSIASEDGATITKKIVKD